MTITTIYRVETSAGDGPYFPLGGCYHISLPFDPALHPEPWDEGLNIEHDAMLCGFSSEEQLHNWFYAELVETLVNIPELEFFVSEYNVPVEHVVHGQKQALFNREHACLVSQRSLIPADASVLTPA